MPQLQWSNLTKVALQLKSLAARVILSGTSTVYMLLSSSQRKEHPSVSSAKIPSPADRFYLQLQLNDSISGLKGHACDVYVYCCKSILI